MTDPRELAKLFFEEDNPVDATYRTPADHVAAFEKWRRSRDPEWDPMLRWGSLSEDTVPIDKAYDEARERIDQLESQPDAPHHQEVERQFYGGRGWGRHFGLACEDLDRLDYAVSSCVTVELDKRNRMRREISCVRTHLLDAYDESTKGKTQRDKELWE